MARSGPAAAVTLGVLVALAAGLGAGVWLTRPDVPASLADGSALTIAPVSERAYDDPRTVTLTVTTQDEQSLASLVTGRVTRSSCSPGTPITSGSSVVAVDGAGLLALATATPLWRDLTIGDRGADVAALNAELVRLGRTAPASDRVTRATVAAYTAVATAAGAPAATRSVIGAAAVMWLPAPSVAVSACQARTGDLVTQGDPLVDLQAGQAASVDALPAGAVAGARVLVVDDERVPVSPDGQVADPAALATVLASGTYASATPDDDGTRELSLTWVLTEPEPVHVVPPGAVGGAGSDRTCLVGTDGTVHPVRVVGSELGQTFVAPDGDGGTAIPDQVQASPSATACG